LMTKPVYEAELQSFKHNLADDLDSLRDAGMY